MEKLLEILKEIKPEIDFTQEENLIEREILTSFDIIRLVSELNNEYDIEISPLYIVPENFKSAQAIFDLVTNIQDDD